MMDVFDTALEFTLRWEGGYSEDPADPGGATKYGISARAYPTVNIKALTVAAAGEIYRRDFWSYCHGDQLPPRLALALFDTAINCGPAKAVRLLQQTLRVPADGVIGPQTITACWEKAEAAAIKDVLTEFLSRRVLFYADLTTFSRFGLGWVKRCFALLDAALKIT